MAKKKASSNIGLILTLVFFVLATFIAGTVAYFGYEEIETHKGKAVEAKKKEDLATAQYREERVRKAILRTAIGAEDSDDRVLIAQEAEPFRTQIRDEFDRIKRSLGDNQNIPKVADPNDKSKQVSAFDWPLVGPNGAQVVKELDGKSREEIGASPAVKPLMYIPDIIKIYKSAAEQSEKLRLDSEAKMANFKKNSEDTGAEKTKIKQEFDKAIAALDTATKDKHLKLDKDFQALTAKHANDAKAAIDRAAKLGIDDNNKADMIAQLNDKIKQLSELVNKLQDAANGANRGAVGVDFVNLEEKKGEIVRREEGGYVIINIGASKKLKPQITFLVVSADTSWLALLDKEKSLDANSTRLDRQPFENNPYVKAGIEVVEILGSESARCKIIFENEPIRNPVQIRDGIFNLAWKPDEEIRIAFAGIIDLDGDGLDNNEDFLRLLERQGIIVDEYLKLKPLDFVKRDLKGMSLRTRYLVIAPDQRLEIPVGAAAVTAQSLQIQAAMGKMSEIRGRAKDLGVQLIEARKFLAMIGYKLPKNPSPPQYGAGAYIGGAIPMEKKDGN